jgi:hypothetical protein
VAEDGASRAGQLGGVALADLRDSARRETREAAEAYSASIGIDAPTSLEPGGLIAMSGHQPEFFHAGVWAKVFLLQRFCDASGALGIDTVVDTDTVGSLDARVPCLRPTPRVCENSLVREAPGVTYAQASAPEATAIDEFARTGDLALETLPAPAIRRHFAEYCARLREVAAGAGNLGMALTAARRAFERSAGTDYLELPISVQAQTPSWQHVSASILCDAERFASTHNAQLESFRARTETRSSAQPFPNLGRGDDGIESPLWCLRGGLRASVWVKRAGARQELVVAGETLASLSTSPSIAAEELLRSGLTLAPKALLLTLFERLFVADLFIHGTGGARYDRVTDGVIAEYLGVRPPPFVVASMTLMLPIGGHVPDDAEIAAVREQRNRAVHNPDQLLASMDPQQISSAAKVLMEEKAALVVAIESSDADKKALGRRIRDVNAALAEEAAPIVRGLDDELEELAQATHSAAVLGDRTYPFCLWDAREVADKVR